MKHGLLALIINAGTEIPEANKQVQFFHSAEVIRKSELLLKSRTQYSTIAVKDFGSRLAPPTSAPSISSSAISDLTLSGFTEPP